MFTGCSKNDELSIKICGFSDSISANPHKLEYDEWNKSFFNDSKAKKNITVWVGDLEVSGKYIKSENRFSEFYTTHTYEDENNCYFDLTDDGKLSSYFWGSNPSKENEGQKYSEEECIDIAKAFISDITDVSQYTVNSEYSKDEKMYTISFVKYVDGFKCSDQAEICIEETGHIYSFFSTLLGCIPPDAETNFDLEDIQAKIISKLDIEYSQAKQLYDMVSYETFDYQLTIDTDGKYALVCSVDVKCTESYGEYDSILSERIQLLIQK